MGIHHRHCAGFAKSRHWTEGKDRLYRIAFAGAFNKIEYGADNEKQQSDHKTKMETDCWGLGPRALGPRPQALGLGPRD